MGLSGGSSEASIEHDVVESWRHELDKRALGQRKKGDWILVPRLLEHEFLNDFSLIKKTEALYFRGAEIPTSDVEVLEPEPWDESGTIASFSAGSGAAELRDFFRSENRRARGRKAQVPDPVASEDSGWAGDVNSTGNFWADLGQAISDPVNSVNGEFYVNDVDLAISGPFPFQLRRNYTSLNTFANEFGYGWKSGFFPYLVVGPGEWVLHAAEPDGSVIAYEKKAENLWQPTLVKNPNWVNSNGSSSASDGNLFNAKITRAVDGNGTVYTLDAVDGSRRVFRQRSFPNGAGLQRTRPYLESWHDHRGNGWSFTFGTDPMENGYGEVVRMDSTGGASFVFSHDSAGRVTAAEAGDGRRVDYAYDEHGDLVEVVRPDASVVQYAYGRESGGTVSNHLLIRETKPEGRVLENDYDASRRVIEQRATVGEGTQPVRNATFIYSQVAETDGSKTGHTLVRDAYNREGRYDYVKSQLTRVRDPLGLETLQTWYAAGDTTAGAYPRSLKRRTDKRGVISDFSYDAFGNLVTVSVTGDRTGDGTAETATTSTAYNSIHLPVEIVLPGGRRTVIRYEDANFPRLPTTIESYAGELVTSTRRVYGDVSSGPVAAKGLLLSETRAFGFEDAAETLFSYTPAGFLLSTTQSTGSGDPNVVRTFVHNARGEMVEEADALGRTVRYAYDGIGRRTGTEFRDETGALVGWDYQTFDGNGELVLSDGSRTNPEDQVARTYDRAGRLVGESRSRSVANANGNGTEAASPAITSHRYNLFGNLVETTLPNQSVVSMTHDANGRMSQRVVRDSSANLLAQESWTYEPGDQVATHTDPLGGVTTNTYTSDGQLKSVTRPDGTLLEWRYQLDGRPVREPVTHNTAWHIAYNDAARTVTRTLKALNGATLATKSETFDRRGNRISETDVDSHTFTAAFDGLDRPKTATGPAASGSSAQQVTTYSYDAAGRVTTVANSSGESVVTTRDVMGRMISMEVSGPNGIARLTGYEYSPDHNSVTVTDGSGPGAISTQTWTDTFGQTVLVSHADGSFRSSVFDVAGRVVSSTDELGRTTTYLHDGLGRMTRETRPDGAVTNFTHNAAGNLTGRLMPGGLNWTATYDTAGRITGETLTGGGETTRQFTYTYHASGPQNGLLNTVADPRGITRTTTYDEFRRPQSIAATGSQSWQNLTVATTYDNRGNPLTITRTGGDQPGTEISRVVDGYGQITSESVSLGGQPHSAINHTWDAAGRRSGLSSGTGFDVAFTHDAAGQLTSTSEGSQTASFTYGTNGLLDSRTSPFRSQSVTSRDSRGRVLGQTTSANAAAVLSEGMTWRADSTMDSYSAIRSGLHAWNESKAFAYNNRGQLLSESFAPWDDASRTINYQFDSGTPGVGVRTKAEVGSGGNTNWFVNASTVNPLARVTAESANNLLRTIPASGIAFGADRVEADINGVLFGDATHPGWADATGAWSINLPLPAGENRLTVRAKDIPNRSRGCANKR